mmetsp:Transcript_62711/g.198590  ORF Transcript_62711/g.198590 Transcript_62711/m.198590 type:complete len:499 (-) Transcript_62711:41-1537(-)
MQDAKEEAAVRIQARHRGRKARAQLQAEKDELEDAATKIQSMQRGRKTRRAMQDAKEEEAALVIQRRAKQHMVHKEVRSRHQAEDEAVANHAAAVIQSHIKGVLTRKQFAEQYDRQAVCICNRLAYGRMLICDDCFESFHLECAGYTPESLPDPRVPWVCHNCTAIRDPVDLVISAKPHSAAASLVRVRVKDENDLPRVGLRGAVVPRSMADPLAGMLGAEDLNAAIARRRAESATPALPSGAQARMERVAVSRAGVEDEAMRLRVALEELMLDHYGDFKSVPPAVGVDPKRPQTVPALAAVSRPTTSMSAQSALAYVRPGGREREMGRVAATPGASKGAALSRQGSSKRGKPPSSGGKKAARESTGGKARGARATPESTPRQSGGVGSARRSSALSPSPSPGDMVTPRTKGSKIPANVDTPGSNVSVLSYYGQQPGSTNQSQSQPGYSETKSEQWKGGRSRKPGARAATDEELAQQRLAGFAEAGAVVNMSVDSLAA